MLQKLMEVMKTSWLQVFRQEEFQSTAGDNTGKHAADFINKH
jgi:hypothetical protein